MCANAEAGDTVAIGLYATLMILKLMATFTTNASISYHNHTLIWNRWTFVDICVTSCKC